jgi:hypothetical protein
MVRKISVCVFAAFYAGLFLACSHNDDEVTKPKEEPLNLVELDYEWTQIVGNGPFFSSWWNKDGFFQSDSHPYGFDRHPYPKEGIAEDSIAYVSVLNNGYGEVKVKINQNLGSSSQPSDYFICEPEFPYNSLSAIFDNSKDEHIYAVTASINANGRAKKIALCKDTETGIQKLQELHIIPYNWKNDYDFYVYILGDTTKTDGEIERHQLLRLEEFWELFNKVFKQAVVKHGDLFGKIVSAGKVKIKDSPSSPERVVDRDYVLTRARGNYESDCVVGDIGEVLKDIESRTEHDSSTRRNIVYVSYPTKRFWPVKKDDDSDNIQICGTHSSDEDPKKFDNLELEPILNPGCKATIKASVSWDNSMNVWKLKYSGSSLWEIATTDNVKSDCAVFAENILNDTETSLGNRYIGEISAPNAYGQMRPIWNAVAVLLPWLSTIAAKVSIHELGHTMGLVDVSEDGLSRLSERSEEENLMHESIGPTDYKLRKRGIIPKKLDEELLKGLDKDRKEHQWDCLHETNLNFCIMPYYNPYYNP